MRAHHMNLEAHTLAQDQCQKNVVAPGSHMGSSFPLRDKFSGGGELVTTVILGSTCFPFGFHRLV